MARFCFYVIFLLYVTDNAAWAAQASWMNAWVSTTAYYGESLVSYTVSGSVRSDTGASGSLQGLFFEHEEGGRVYLKSYDYGAEGIMAPVKNAWALTFYGEVLNEATFENMVRLELCDYADSTVGGTVIANPSDFYLAIMTTEYGVENGETWYGWFHFSIAENKEISLLGYNLGDSLVVGTIPEPSGAVLLLLGCAGLLLRRHVYLES